LNTIGIANLLGTIPKLFFVSPEMPERDKMGYNYGLINRMLLLLSHPIFDEKNFKFIINILLSNLAANSRKFFMSSYKRTIRFYEEFV